ncbi:ATP-grasp domain-containing protein [Streptomyces phaeochromogenes]|uniref:ATP-grasp domain-containing protein n=1 Tax=Streptomyces phaeochromogenes TaxID=1923 RepID=UPI002E2D0F5A|nr:ATP-grasp domain-containing protein [Streptomyces phaeochromogenes]
MSHPMLLVIGSGPRPLGGYLLEQTAAHYPVLLINGAPMTWQKPYVIDHEVADLSDPIAVNIAAASLAVRWPIAGVLTWDEFHLMAAARLAHSLGGRPGNTLAAVAAARDKATSRQRFAAAGVPSAASTWVHSLAAAASAAERVGYPVVLKPAACTGGIGVIRVDTITDLPAAWAIASAGAAHQGPDGDGVLVEEYLHGDEISVETVTHRGVTSAVAVTRKAVGFAPYFLETGHSVSAGDPLLHEVAPVASAALEALGITHGVSHTDLRLTPEGPRVIEVNARHGGDLIGELVRLATGISLPLAAAALACGEIPNLRPTRQRSAAIGMIYPPAEGIVTHRDLRPGSDQYLEHFQWLCDVGDTATLTPSSTTPNNLRAGYAVVSGDSAHDAQQHLADVLARADVKVTSAVPRAA